MREHFMAKRSRFTERQILNLIKRSGRFFLFFYFRNKAYLEKANLLVKGTISHST